MKKGLLLLMMGLMALGLAVKANADARLDSMSQDPRFVEDMDLIWLYPNKALEYKDTVDFRLNDTEYNDGWGQGYAEWGGVLKDMGDVGVIGAYANRPYYTQTYFEDMYNHNESEKPADWYNRYMPYGGGWSPAGQWSGNMPNNANYYPNTPQNKVDAFWAKSFSGMDLGAMINYADNQEYGALVNNYSQDLGINLGLGTANLGPFSQANFHLSYQMGSFDTGIQGGESAMGDGIYSLAVGALLVNDVDADNSVRVTGDVRNDQWNTKDIQTGNPTTHYQSNQFTVDLGAGINHKISGGKGVVASGLMLVYDGYKVTDDSYTPTAEYEGNSWMVLWNASVESQLTGWLTWRAGIFKPIFDRDYDVTKGQPGAYGNNDPYSKNGTYSTFSTGFGINVENWTLDAQVSVYSLEQLISNPSLGGILYDNYNSIDNGSILSITEADLKYKF
jgi:hypothetical protein